MSTVVLGTSHEGPFRAQRRSECSENAPELRRLVYGYASCDDFEVCMPEMIAAIALLPLN
jgi:hypothetical protein